MNLGSPIWWDKALSRPKVDGCVPHTQRGNLTIVGQSEFIWPNVFIHKFQKVHSPTKPSTYCLLQLIKILSWWYCGGVDFLKRIDEYTVSDKTIGQPEWGSGRLRDRSQMKVAWLKIFRKRIYCTDRYSPVVQQQSCSNFHRLHFFSFTSVSGSGQGSHIQRPILSRASGSSNLFCVSGKVDAFVLQTRHINLRIVL